MTEDAKDLPVRSAVLPVTFEAKYVFRSSVVEMSCLSYYYAVKSSLCVVGTWR